MNGRKLRLIVAMIVGGLIGALMVKQGVLPHAVIKRNFPTLILLILLFGIMAARSFIRANKGK